jgi:hypothetical protein
MPPPWRPCGWREIGAVVIGQCAPGFGGLAPGSDDWACRCEQEDGDHVFAFAPRRCADRAPSVGLFMAEGHGGVITGRVSLQI